MFVERERSADFAQLTVERPYTSQWAPPLFPKASPLPMGGSAPATNTWFLGPTRVITPNGISTGSAVFAGLMKVTDKPTNRVTNRPTDHANPHAAIGQYR